MASNESNTKTFDIKIVDGKCDTKCNFIKGCKSKKLFLYHNKKGIGYVYKKQLPEVYGFILKSNTFNFNICAIESEWSILDNEYAFEINIRVTILRESIPSELLEITPDEVIEKCINEGYLIQCKAKLNDSFIQKYIEYSGVIGNPWFDNCEIRTQLVGEYIGEYDLIQYVVKYTWNGTQFVIKEFINYFSKMNKKTICFVSTFRTKKEIMKLIPKSEYIRKYKKIDQFRNELKEFNYQRKLSVISQIAMLPKKFKNSELLDVKIAHEINKFLL
jgi:hypothetical protein